MKPLFIAALVSAMVFGPIRGFADGLESREDSLLRRAYQTRNAHVLQFIKKQKTGGGDLSDPSFRAKLKAKLDLIDSGTLENERSEAQYFESNSRGNSYVQSETPSGFNNSYLPQMMMFIAMMMNSQNSTANAGYPQQGWTSAGSGYGYGRGYLYGNNAFRGNFVSPWMNYGSAPAVINPAQSAPAIIGGSNVITNRSSAPAVIAVR